MCIRDSVETDTRDEYLRAASGLRRAGEDGGEGGEEHSFDLPAEYFGRLADAEQFILTVTERGFGKRSSAYEYRTTGRGGKGIANIETTERNGPVVASFPVGSTDQIMLVTDSGQLIRFAVDEVRIAGRRTQGVTLFRIEENERVVSVAHLSEVGDDEDAEKETEEAADVPDAETSDAGEED